MFQELNDERRMDARVAMIRLAGAIRERNEEWERGEATSPDTYDYVHDGDFLLTAHYPNYPGRDRDFLSDVADELFEDYGETYRTDEEVAGFIIRSLLGE